MQYYAKLLSNLDFWTLVFSKEHKNNSLKKAIFGLIGIQELNNK